MSINYTLINKTIDSLIPLPEHFGISIGGIFDDVVLHNIDDIKQAVLNIVPDANVIYGMSKLVIAAPAFGGVVIKIPFNGYFSVGKYNNKSYIQWIPFVHAQGSNLYKNLEEDDYCLTEYIKYKKLRVYNLSCFVAKTKLYKTINNVKFFLQEEVISSEDIYKPLKPSKKSLEIANSWYEDGEFYIDANWIACCIDSYGTSKVKRFLYYCANIDPELLEDMHDGNYGYRKNNSPCLLDFSNYLD